MAFKYDQKLKQLNNFVKQQKETGVAGQSSRARTKKMIGLGEAYADQTSKLMESSAKGVRKLYDQVDVGSSRGKDADVDFQMAAWMQALEEQKMEDVTDPGTPEPSKLDFDEGKIEFALAALGDVESLGSGGYQALGPVVNKGMYKGQRAHGKYAVMPGNIPSWTKKYYGTQLTPSEFLQNEQAQDIVAENMLMANWEKYGSIEDSVSVWFTGRPLAKATADGAADQNITAPEYLDRWRKYYNKRLKKEFGDK
jgi:hypothetical protein